MQGGSPEQLVVSYGKNSAATFLDRGAKLIHRVFCPHPSLSGFSDVLMCCTETRFCGAPLLCTSSRANTSRTSRAPTGFRNNFNTGATTFPDGNNSLEVSSNATYNSKDFYGRADHTKFFVMGVVVATEYLLKRGIVYRDLKPENVLLTESFVEDLNNYTKMATDVTIVAENIDHETAKDFGFESLVENLNSYMMMATDVINVAGNIDHETRKDFGFESLVEKLNSYWKTMTDEITVAGNIDHVTMKDYEFETFIQGQNCYMKMDTGVISVAGNIDSENMNDIGSHVHEPCTGY